MPSFKSSLLCATCLALLYNETAVELALTSLITAHVTLKASLKILYELIKVYQPGIAARLPGFIDNIAMSLNSYYKQVTLFMQPTMRTLGVSLAAYTYEFVRYAPYGLCKLGAWVAHGVEGVSMWLVGGGAEEMVVQALTGATKEELAAYCSSIGRCS